MKVRFQADADLHHAIVAATVRHEPGVDFQTASTAGLRGVKDPQVLSLAAQEGRILVTHDQTTMPHHFAEFITQQVSAGVLIIPQHVPVAAAMEELILIWVASEAEEWVNRICFLPL
jgi:hypothetical protein